MNRFFFNGHGTYLEEVLPETYSELCQTSKMERFVELSNDIYLLTIFSKRSILDVWQGSK